MKKVIAVVLLWSVCGFINYGSYLGAFEHEFPYMHHRPDAIMFSLLGPFGIPATVIGAQGRFTVHEASCEERWKIFHNEWPYLEKDYFERGNC